MNFNIQRQLCMPDSTLSVNYDIKYFSYIIIIIFFFIVHLNNSLFVMKLL